jgi:hypothetical protein
MRRYIIIAVLVLAACAMAWVPRSAASQRGLEVASFQNDSLFYVAMAKWALFDTTYVKASATDWDSLLAITGRLDDSLKVINAELLAQGLTFDSLKIELLAQGVSLDSAVAIAGRQEDSLAVLIAEQLAQGLTFDSLKTEQIAQGVSLDSLVASCVLIRDSLNVGLLFWGLIDAGVDSIELALARVQDSLSTINTSIGALTAVLISDTMTIVEVLDTTVGGGANDTILCDIISVEYWEDLAIYFDVEDTITGTDSVSYVIYAWYSLDGVEFAATGDSVGEVTDETSWDVASIAPLRPAPFVMLGFVSVGDNGAIVRFNRATVCRRK